MHALVVSDPTETFFVNASCGAVNQKWLSCKKYAVKSTAVAKKQL